VVAERVEQRSRLDDRFDAVGRDRHTDRLHRLDVADAQAVGCLQHGRRVGHDRRRQVVGVGRIVTADGFSDKRNPVEPSAFGADRVTGTDCRLVGQTRVIS